MKNLIKKARQNRYFLLFVFLFAYIHTVYMRITIRQEINAYTFTPEAALGTLLSVSILFVTILFFVRRWQRSEVFSSLEMFKIFSASLVVYIFILQFSGLLIAFIFNNIERNFNRETFIFSALSDLLDGFIYGSFFLAYYYYNKNKNHQEQLASYYKVLSESKINQLKAQLNPHFLFNNLNVLDQLIEEDKHKASDFLNEFAEIYRYVLQTSDKKLISLNEELDFARQYFKLIQHKYGAAYQLNFQININSGFIVPLTLQLLIENAIQHNLGTEKRPVLINIDVSEVICVTNNSNPKRNVKRTSGRALNNLQEQYKLLTKNPIEIRQSDINFSVIIPVINTKDI